MSFTLPQEATMATFYQDQEVHYTRDAKEGDRHWNTGRDQIRATFPDGHERTIDRADMLDHKTATVFDQVAADAENTAKATRDTEATKAAVMGDQPDRATHRWGYDHFTHDKDGRDEAQANGPDHQAMAVDAVGRPVHGPATPLAAHVGDPSRPLNEEAAKVEAAQSAERATHMRAAEDRATADRKATEDTRTEEGRVARDAAKVNADKVAADRKLAADQKAAATVKPTITGR
jgi:hypothetical protein